MTQPISIDRYFGEWALLSKLADHLRQSRLDAYSSMVLKDQLTKGEAAVDKLAREAIARDWRAIAGDKPRSGDADCGNPFKVRTLEQAMAGAQLRLERLSSSDSSYSAAVDLRDATACLLHYQRSPTGGPLGWQAERRARLAAAQTVQVAA
jgi:hypothetical protein